MAHDEQIDRIESALAGYRAELDTHAALAEAELAELEDHFRELIDELRAAGAATATAIAAARTRLGEPRALALECARVRTAFGARLSRPRAWCAATIMLLMTVWTLGIALPREGLVSWVGAEIALGLGLLLGLFARRAWPRAVLFGYAAMTALACTAYAAIWPGHDGILVTLACHAATAVLLAPWRRAELSASGWALVAWSVAYFGASYAVIEATAHHGFVVASLGIGLLWPVLALLGVAVSALGTVLRARWGVVAGFVTAGLLAMLLLGLASADRHVGVRGQHALALAMVAGGVLAALVAPWLALRAARPGFGRLRDLVYG